MRPWLFDRPRLLLRAMLGCIHIVRPWLFDRPMLLLGPSGQGPVRLCSYSEALVVWQALAAPWGLQARALLGCVHIMRPWLFDRPRLLLGPSGQGRVRLCSYSEALIVSQAQAAPEGPVKLCSCSEVLVVWQAQAAPEGLQARALLGCVRIVRPWLFDRPRLLLRASKRGPCTRGVPRRTITWRLTRVMSSHCWNNRTSGGQDNLVTRYQACALCISHSN